MSAADIYANARALAGYLKEKSAEIDKTRRLPSEVASRLRDAGMFRLMMPKEWGGPELSPTQQVEVIEELAKANASAAWCVMIGCDSGFFAGYLDGCALRAKFILASTCPLREASCPPAMPSASRVDFALPVSGHSARGLAMPTWWDLVACSMRRARR